MVHLGNLVLCLYCFVLGDEVNRRRNSWDGSLWKLLHEVFYLGTPNTPGVGFGLHSIPKLYGLVRFFLLQIWLLNGVYASIRLLFSLHAHWQQRHRRETRSIPCLFWRACKLWNVHITLTRTPHLSSWLPGIRAASGSTITLAQCPASSAPMLLCPTSMLHRCDSIRQEVRAHIFHPQYCLCDFLIWSTSGPQKLILYHLKYFLFDQLFLEI